MGVIMADEQWLTVQEVADELHVSPQAVHRWRNEPDPKKRLLCVQVHGVIRIKRSELEDFLSRHTNNT